MKLSQALEARVLHVTPIPKHVLLIHFTVPELSDGDQGAVEHEDHIRLVNLAGIPSLRGLVGNWQVVREVRIVRDGQGLAWPSGDRVPALWLIVAPLSRELRAERLMEFLAPVRRPRKAQMH